MQLLRVASSMSYQGSPYSCPGDEYDFEDDAYDDLDEFRDQEEALPPPALDDSDEDTEEASETDIPNNDEPVEIKEQMYQDKLANLKKQLQQLEEGVHPEFLRRVKRLEHQLHERLRLNKIYNSSSNSILNTIVEQYDSHINFNYCRDLYVIDCKKWVQYDNLQRFQRYTGIECHDYKRLDHMYDVVEKEYITEKKAAAKEFEDKKVELRENLLTDFEDKRKMIENEKQNMELNGDSMEVKPVMKRILRRRANEPAPVPEKRRKPLTTTLTFQLDERDIEADLRTIARHPPHTPHTPHTRKHLNSTSESPVREGGETLETRVEDGKLLYERRWFHRGQSVYVEGRDQPRYPAHIHAITDDAIWVKKTTLEKVRIYVSQLARGKLTIKRRAS